jgi:hypothetical protein
VICHQNSLPAKKVYHLCSFMGTSRQVGKAVIRAIQNDIPQLIINPYPVRPMFALSEMSPRLGAWIARAMGASKFFEQVYESRK